MSPSLVKPFHLFQIAIVQPLFFLGKTVLRNPNPVTGSQGDLPGLINLETRRHVHRERCRPAILPLDHDAAGIVCFYRDPLPTPEPGDVLMELDDLPGLIIAGIGALRFRPLQIFELDKLALIRAEFLGGFQFRPNFARHPLAFRVRRRNDQGRLVFADGRSVIRRQRLMPLVGIHFPQHSKLVQSLESTFKIAARKSATTALCASAFCRRISFSSAACRLACFSKRRSASPRSTARCCAVSPERMIRQFSFSARSATRASVRTLKSPASSIQITRPRTCVLQFLILQQCLDRLGIGKSGIRPQHPARGFRRRRERENFLRRSDSMAATASFIIVVLPVPAPPRMAVTRSVLCRTCRTALRCSSESFGF